MSDFQKPSSNFVTIDSCFTEFGIPRKLVYDQDTSFMITDFSTFLLQFGFTHAPRTKWSPWTKGEVEKQNKYLSRYFRFYLFGTEKIWAKLAFQFVFAHNTSVNTSTGTTSCEIVFGFKPQIPINFSEIVPSSKRQWFMSVPILSSFNESYACEQGKNSFMRRQFNILEKLNAFTQPRNSIEEHITQSISENPRSQYSFSIVQKQVQTC